MQLILLLLFLKLGPLAVLSKAEDCDRARTARVREGNLGQSAHFNYIGVLIVHIREFGEHHTAMTGIVLIKDKYALANADDVVKIPQDIFNRNTRAMFLPARNTPRFLKPSSYVTHPEYPHSTLNSIVIIELNLPKVDDFLLTPICLPTAHTSHTSRYLYLTAITDDNKKLEKILHKIQYLDKKRCEELYDDNSTARGLDLDALLHDAGSIDWTDIMESSCINEMVPSQELSAYSCGYAPNIATVCFWENGMALVSNVTGIFNLVGLAVYGPGCAVPARFMDLSRYLFWIHSVTRPEGNDVDDSWRWMGATTKSWNKPVPNVPIHTLFADARRQNAFKHDYEPYPFDVESLKYHVVKPTKDNNSLIITTLDDKWERYDDACERPREPIYKEYFEVKALDKLRGSVTYKLSLYDLEHNTFACIRLTILCKRRSSAILSFKEEIVNYKENVELHDQSGETPEELFKYFPVLKGPEKKINKGNWKEADNFYRPDFLNDENRFYSGNVTNCDLFIKFEFNERAKMHFEMFAESDVLNKSPHIWKQEITTTPPASSTETITTPVPSTETITTPAPSTETITTPAPSTETITTPAPSTETTTTPAPSTETITTPAPSTETITTPAPSTETTTTPAPSTETITTPAPSTETTTTPDSSTETNELMYQNRGKTRSKPSFWGVGNWENYKVKRQEPWL